ncbi:pirin family protein [Govanella unica]|uniref:Pirin family protein n=1 Tax=Govanella unica TaxID=2975056 RepID=A0A9X3Z831_9PROT|nr:pirin family protein [Govania unica]MDA5194731.1 pirin family protein [Govania unica]
MVPAIETIIVGRARDLGGFSVQRVLPSVKRRMVGPFVFLDQMGPVDFSPGQGIDVRPHPHIGLETVTYMFEGEILHRDSLGSVQPITPGAVNWMTAGKGIAHSERSSTENRCHKQRLFGLQLWVALPVTRETMDPSFTHYAADQFPELTGDGLHTRVLAGTLYGKTSPVVTQSELFYGDIRMIEGARLQVESGYEERAAYLVSGAVEIGGDRFTPGQLLVFKPGAEIVITALEAVRLVLLGGAAMDGPRHIWWNFVSSRQDLIEAAKEDWKQGRFDRVIGDTEFIPLPEG